MAKYEARIFGDFDKLLRALDGGILAGSISASFEGGSDCVIGDVRSAVRVYERYSITGSNRVSLSITLVGSGGSNFISAISSGGSQARVFKVNTIGEESFLDSAIEVINKLNHMR